MKEKIGTPRRLSKQLPVPEGRFGDSPILEWDAVTSEISQEILQEEASIWVAISTKIVTNEETSQHPDTETARAENITAWLRETTRLATEALFQLDHWAKKICEDRVESQRMWFEERENDKNQLLKNNANAERWQKVAQVSQRAFIVTGGPLGYLAAAILVSFASPTITTLGAVVGVSTMISHAIGSIGGASSAAALENIERKLKEWDEYTQKQGDSIIKDFQDSLDKLKLQFPKIEDVFEVCSWEFDESLPKGAVCHRVDVSDEVKLERIKNFVKEYIRDQSVWTEHLFIEFSSKLGYEDAVLRAERECNQCPARIFKGLLNLDPLEEDITLTCMATFLRYSELIPELKNSRLFKEKAKAYFSTDEDQLTGSIRRPFHLVRSGKFSELLAPRLNKDHDPVSKKVDLENVVTQLEAKYRAGIIEVNKHLDSIKEDILEEMSSDYWNEHWENIYQDRTSHIAGSVFKKFCLFLAEFTPTPLSVLIKAIPQITGDK